jgi:hypothetical protein
MPDASDTAVASRFFQSFTCHLYSFFYAIFQMLGGAYDFLNRVLEFGALNEFEKLVCNFLLFVSSLSLLGTSPLDDSAARPAQE